jgi:osmotically-inducible protein OsmY
MKSGRAVLLAVAAAGLAACMPPALNQDNSDAVIKARIEQQFMAQRDLDSSHLVLDVHGHIATVSGVVRSWEEKQILERIMRRTSGVDQALINVVIQE